MARTYFEEALRFDRESAAAHVGLYWTERAEGRDAEAREHLERAVALAPGAEADLRRLSDGAADLGHANPRRALRAAIDLLVAGDAERGTTEYFRALEGADEATLSEVLEDAGAFFPDHQRAAALKRADGQAGRAIVDLWMSRDPTPATPANEVLAEAYRRLDRVRRDFAAVRPPGYDDRGRSWLRLGPPDRRLTWGGLDLHPAESWLYERLAGRRVTLHFVRRGIEYARAASALEAIPASRRRELVDAAMEVCRPRVGFLGDREALRNEASMAFLELSDFDPVYLAMAFCLESGSPITGGEVATENLRLAEGATVAESTFAIEHAREGEPADFAARAVAFEDGRGGYDLWVVLGYPVGQLVEAGGATVTVRRAPALHDADWAIVERREGAVRVDASRLGPTDVLVDGLEIRRIGAYRFPVTIDRPDPGRLRLSDVVLVDRILPGETGRFTRGGLRLVPSPTGVFRRSGPVGLYFEIYPPRGAAGEDVRVAVTVRSGRPEPIHERIFGAIRGSDLSLRNDVLHSLQIVCQIVIDVAGDLAARAGLPFEDYTEAVRRLPEAGPFPRELTRELERLPGFRDILIHEYVAIDLERAREALEGLGPIEEFADRLADHLAGCTRAGGSCRNR